MPFDDPLRQELLARADIDQQARRSLDELRTADGKFVARNDEGLELLRSLTTVDTDNTAWMKTVVERHGWPGRTVVGVDGAAAAWVLAQHADLDPSFQRQCLDLMEAAEKGEVASSHIAYLTDRVRLAEGLPQIFGTQVVIRDNGAEPRELVDPADVDSRRAAVGLGPLSGYLASFSA